MAWRRCRMRLYTLVRVRGGGCRLCVVRQRGAQRAEALYVAQPGQYPSSLYIPKSLTYLCRSVCRHSIRCAARTSPTRHLRLCVHWSCAAANRRTDRRSAKAPRPGAVRVCWPGRTRSERRRPCSGTCRRDVVHLCTPPSGARRPCPCVGSRLAVVHATQTHMDASASCLRAGVVRTLGARCIACSYETLTRFRSAHHPLFLRWRRCLALPSHRSRQRAIACSAVPPGALSAQPVCGASSSMAV